MNITYASVCDGIGAAHAAWNPLGMKCAWTSEIDPFPAAVVDHHWNLPNLGDMTAINTKDAINEHGRIQLLVGGTPCQSFSVAGLRKGLDDPRGNLALVFLRLVDELRPEWVVWENVPGVLSSSGGRDFGSFLGGLEELGYGWAYRTLDAQFVRVESHPYAVPQRRRRVFVVGHIGGSWRTPGAVLFERESMSGDSPPSRRARQETARGVGAGVVGTLQANDASKWGSNQWVDEGKCIVQPYPVANCMTRRMHKGINSTLDEGQTPVVACRKSARARVTDGLETWVDDGIANTLNTFDVGDVRSTNLVAFTNNGGDTNLGMSEDTSPPVTTINSSRPNVATDCAVRRLTPTECERLQGFPDHYTAIKYRNKPASDTARYKSLGNSMAVNVMSWIGQRICMMNQIGDLA